MGVEIPPRFNYKRIEKMPVIEKDGIECYVSDEVVRSKIRNGWKLKEIKTNKNAKIIKKKEIDKD